MKRLPRLLALTCLSLAGAGAQAGGSVLSLAGLPRSELQVITASGTHRFKVWIAADSESRARGLMDVRKLAHDEGMLFLFEWSEYTTFWMKDTYLSLDVIFIRADGVVVNVAPNTRPLTIDLIPSAAPVKAVLELLAGTSARIGLTAGDRILHPALSRRSDSTLAVPPDGDPSSVPRKPGNAVLDQTR